MKFIGSRIVAFNNNGSVLWNYEYNLKDHLGNTRVVFTAHADGNPEVNQITSYDPFGFVTTQSNWYPTGAFKNKFLYNGKELNDDQLAGTKLDWYDYGARMYDAQLGRLWSADPMAEKGRRWSPYTYCFNNPNRFIDPDGMWGDDQTGYIRSANTYLKEYHPVKAFFANLSAEFLNVFSPLGAIDDAIVIYKNPNSETGEKISATINAALSLVVIKGEGKTAIGKSNTLNTKSFKGAADYTSIKDPRNLNTSTKPTPRQVKEMKALNREHNEGILRDDVTGEIMLDSKKSVKGITPPPNEVQVDHKKSVKDGGTRTITNLELRTRKNNRDKWYY